MTFKNISGDVVTPAYIVQLLLSSNTEPKKNGSELTGLNANQNIRYARKPISSAERKTIVAIQKQTVASVEKKNRKKSEIAPACRSVLNTVWMVFSTVQTRKKWWFVGVTFVTKMLPFGSVHHKRRCDIAGMHVCFVPLDFVLLYLILYTIVWD